MVRLRMHVEDRHSPPARPALPDPAAGTRRLHRPAVLLARLGRRRPAGRVPRGAAARRRGLGVPGGLRPRSATCSRCADRSGAGSPGTCTRPRSAWSAAPAWCPPSRCCARPAGSAAPTCCGWWRSAAAPTMLPYADELGRAGAAARLHPARHRRPSGRRPHRCRAHPAARRRRAGLRLRLGPVRVVRRDPAARLRCRAGCDPGGAVRSDWLIPVRPLVPNLGDGRLVCELGQADPGSMCHDRLAQG